MLLKCGLMTLREKKGGRAKAQRRKEIKSDLTKMRKCKEKSLCVLATLREEKSAAADPQCCGPGSIGAETQRNKVVSHKGEEAQRKTPLRLGGFAR